MLINADFTRRAVVAPHQYDWVTSPQNGVKRVMLDRVGAEKARATSIVHYAPRSSFPRHQHPGGEEILVLSGTFSDDEADYPAGWYLRNPPGSSHEPSSTEGAVIFVKLQQMSASDQHTVRINTHQAENWQRRGVHDICPLYSSDEEHVYLLRTTSNESLFTQVPCGVELLVLAGSVTTDQQSYEPGSWLRLPATESTELISGPQGTTVYIKTGHLNAPRVEI